MESDGSNRPPPRDSLADDPGWRELVDPLLHLLSRYERIAGRLAALTKTLRELTAEDNGPSALPANQAQTPRIVRPEPAPVDVLLAFQDQLSSMDSVVSVTMTGATAGRTKFLVQLKPPAAEGTPAIVCTECNQTLAAGTGARVSHGLCAECLPDFLRRSQSR